MAHHVKWKFPKREDDFDIHCSSYDIERTLCGLAFEGSNFDHVAGQPFQDLITTTKKITCKRCRQVYDFCQTISKSEFR